MWFEQYVDIMYHIHKKLKKITRKHLFTNQTIKRRIIEMYGHTVLKYYDQQFNILRCKLDSHQYFKNHVQNEIKDQYDFSHLNLCSNDSFGLFVGYFEDFDIFFDQIQKINNVDIIIDLGILFDYVNLYDIAMDHYLYMALEIVVNKTYTYPQFTMRSTCVQKSVKIYEIIIIGYLFFLIKNKSIDNIIEIISNSYSEMPKELAFFVKVSQFDGNKINQMCEIFGNTNISCITNACWFKYLEKYLAVRNIDFYSMVHCTHLSSIIVNSSPNNIIYYDRIDFCKNIQKLVDDKDITCLNDMINSIKSLDFNLSGIYNTRKQHYTYLPPVPKHMQFPAILAGVMRGK